MQTKIFLILIYFITTTIFSVGVEIGPQIGSSRLYIHESSNDNRKNLVNLSLYLGFLSRVYFDKYFIGGNLNFFINRSDLLNSPRLEVAVAPNLDFGYSLFLSQNWLMLPSLGIGFDWDYFKGVHLENGNVHVNRNIHATYHLNLALKRKINDSMFFNFGLNYRYFSTNQNINTHKLHIELSYTWLWRNI